LQGGTPFIGLFEPIINLGGNVFIKVTYGTEDSFPDSFPHTNKIHFLIKDGPFNKHIYNDSFPAKV
jgi:hypothetical protein